MIKFYFFWNKFIICLLPGINRSLASNLGGQSSLRPKSISTIGIYKTKINTPIGIYLYKIFQSKVLLPLEMQEGERMIRLP